MKTIEAFLIYLNSLNIKFREENGLLRYSAPKGTITPALSKEMAERKAEIITFLRQANLVAHSHLPAIRPAPRDEELPLSFAQQRLWFLDQFIGENSTYNITVALRLEGPLHRNALEQSLREIVQRHETLRTTFPMVNGKPVPLIHELSAINYQLSDVKLPREEQELEVQRLINEEAQRPFDLSKGPLFRSSLLQLSVDSHVLLLTIHHIIYDGWSIKKFNSELSTLYNAFSQGQPSPLSPLPIQYTDFAYWQRQWLSGDVLKTQFEYWKKQLAGIPPLLELPTDYPRPPIQRYQGATCRQTLNVEICRQLKSLSQQTGTSPFMTLLSAFATLLFRYTGSHDIAIGSPIANRNHSQIESIIGFFVNTLVLRINLEGNPSFKELQQRVKRVTLDADANQDTPFEKLVEEFQPEKNLSYSPLFQVMFSLQNARFEEALELNDLKVSLLEPDNTTAKFDLNLNVVEHGDVFVCDWEYNTDLFRPETVSRMTQHFHILLEGILNNSEQSLYQLPLLTSAEQQQLLAWNQTQTDYPLDKTIVDLFQAQVEKTPENVAVVFEGQALSYQALNTKANHLAHYLMTLGVGAETLVGICVERSLEMVVGLLGILKAGGAYVPLDPAYPQERLQFMLEDSEIEVLLSQSHLLERLPVSTAKVVCLDSEWEQIAAGYSGENPVTQSGPENLAYMIYTSGSTGVPKGAMNLHQGIYNRLLWMQDAYQLTVADNVLQKTPFSFDVSVWEFFWPLLVGARLTVAKPGGHKETDYLIKLIQQEQITTLHFVPSMLQVFLQAPALENIHALKRVICSGEALPVELQARFFANLPATVELHNLYGPTEAAIDVTYWACQRDNPLNTIGRPIANTQIDILDANHNPTPIGIPGELCIAGAGLARGYKGRSELTAEKFIEIELFGHKQRIYKTGDLARWLPDGNLSYLGRIDNQVKLRGFRIELGEIEATLTQHENVKEAVVILHTKENNPRLVAYITLAMPIDEVYGVLRTWLKTRLPEYMLPASFTVLDKLPLTPNGKIDRKALPEPDLTVSTSAYEAPRTETEQCLVEVWNQVLKQTDIGIFDNFFEQGGDSILSIQIVAQAREVGLEIGPRDLFQHQTIAELAQVVRPRASFVAEQGLVSGKVPFTPIQQAFFERQPKEPWHFNQAILLAVPADINQVALQSALATILQHHDALRLRYQKIDEQWQQWHDVVSTEELPYHIEDLSHLSKQAQAQALHERSDFWQASLNLETGPLVRLVLFHLGSESRLLWCIHHLAVDGVSWRILLEDLQTAYHQAVASQPIRLPAKTSAFKAWAEHLFKWKDSESFATQTEYWLKLPKAATPLPIDNPTGRNRIVDSQHYTIHLTADTTQRLLTEVPAAYRTQINDLLLTALMLTLRDWTGDTRHLIDLESHGRADLFEEIDLSRTVGWFTALYTLSLQLPTETDLSTALKLIKEQLRQVPHDGVGYGILRYLCHESLPQGQILFNYLGQFDQSVSETEWNFATEDSGRAHSLQGEREHLIEINGQTINGCLSLTWSYSGEQYQAQTIQKLADNYQQQLQQLIEHCAASYGYTPSDFPLATLSLPQLDQLAQSYGNNIADIYPLSPMQQGLLFHSLYAPESGIYFEQLHCGLSGQLNLEAFRQAWQHLIDRHTILRTAFLHETDTPLQLVYKTAKLSWQTLDWREFSEAEQRQQLQSLLTTERSQGFELHQAPLMRLQLIRETDLKSRLVWNHHHLLIDGWCLPILFTELFEAYEAFAAGKNPHLPPIRPYRAYITWLSQQDQAMAKAYWQEQLKGFTAPTQLPMAQNREEQADYQELTLTLESQQLKQFSRQHRLTLNTLIQGAWAALLSRYSGESEVVFGVITSGRQIPVTGIDRMLGLFINTLPLRVEVANNDILSVLQSIQLRQQQNDQYAYTALADIQNWSEVPNGIALFDTLVVFENYPVDEKLKEEHTGKLQITDLQAIEYTNYPITLAVIPGQELHFKLTYDSNRFQKESIERMLAHLSRLLEALVAQSSQAWYQLPMLTEAEQQQLQAWSQTQTDYPKDQTIVDLFQAQVEKTPNNIAVVFEGQALSYQLLNTKANQLAHYLMTLGVGAETLVGICVERSLEMVIGLLGILKAGGAYVPLDPAYPQERLQFMLEDSSVSVLLSQSQMLERLPVSTAQVVCLDSKWKAIAAGYSGENPVRQSGPENIAYVIYTSGSTGKPKGCLVTQSNVTRLFATTEAWYHFNNQDVWTLFHSYAFDFSVWELWGALLYGGKLVVVPYFTSRTPEAFYQLLIEQNVTVLNQTPSAFKQLINVDNQPDELSLRLVIFGGEALDFATLQPWFARHGELLPQLVNMYGITETTVHVTYYPLISEQNHSNSIIGTPLPDLQVWVVDAHHQPVPIGVSGEMLVGGGGVTRGYLNRPELSKEKFIEIEVFGKSQRFYKTGDLARWLPDGNLEYLGRIDNQVKLRGFRIELGEIEAVLAQHPAIEASIVTTWASGGQEKRLVAYLLPAAQSELPEIHELQTFLKQYLPNYMLPAVFVAIEQIPLNANGKIDYKALPSPTENRLADTQTFVAPGTPEEHLLVKIWQDVLKAKQISIHNNFFELGGDSILSIRIVAKVKQAGYMLAIQDIFLHPTIAQLAQRLKGQETQIYSQPISMPFSLISETEKAQLPADVEDAYPLAALQAGMLFHSQYEQDSGVYHDVFSYYLQTPYDESVLQAAVQQLSELHPVLRTSFHFKELSEPLQFVHRMVQVPFAVSDIRHLSVAEQETEIDEWIKTEKLKAFDWESAPLLRVWIHRRQESAFNLTLSFHHAIADGWSVASLMTELLRDYLHRMDYMPATQALRPNLHYRDFIALEREAIASEATQAFWQQQLEDTSLAHLPRLPEAYRTASTNNKYEVVVPSTLSKAIKQLAESIEVPVKTVLLAAHLRVISLFSGQSDVVSGLVTNGRPESEDGEKIAGLFLNTIPFRMQLQQEESWTQLIQAAFQKEQALLPHRRYPLFEIQQTRQALFETAFNFTNFHVFQDILETDAIKLLGIKGFEQTNFVLTSNFSLDMITGDVQMGLSYNPDELGLNQIKSIALYYLQVLTTMVEQPAAFSNVCLLPVAEVEQLQHWNATETDYPKDQTIVDLFQAQVEKTPENVAVVFEGQALSYQVLNTKANQLAHYLMTLGVSAETLVGICVERSLEMVIGLLGILKAGGAYVPLDPDYPQERLQFMLEDSEVKVLLSQSHLLERLPVSTAKVVCLDSEWEQIAADYSGENPVRQSGPENIAYVIYTSGSTGVPKGAMNLHQAIYNRLLWMQDAYQLTLADNVLQKTPFSFDVSVWEFFWPLLVGARLTVAKPGGHKESDYLVKLIEQEQITTLHFVPSMLQVFLQAPTLENIHALKRVICSGEALPVELQARFFAKLPATVELHNLYGPTEAAIDVTYWACQRDNPLNLVPIGRPIANTQIDILDAHHNPTPLGIPGELCIAGAGLARGYKGRSELTAEKFIETELFGQKQRIYKTGDLARWLPDGNIEYLGRLDHQVKLRGFRIELGEIEAVLSQHQAVKETVVVLYNKEDNPRLVAYVTLAMPTDEVSSVLRTWLKTRLPEYMLPASFTVLDKLPLTPNGKIDRKALPEPDLAIQAVEQAPQTETEHLLCNLWSQVLGISVTSRLSHFFEAGGHSLLATQLVSRLRDSFGIEMPLRVIFEQPLLQEQAEWLDNEQRGSQLPPIIPLAEGSPLVLSFAQQRLWFLGQLEGQSATYNMPAALHLSGQLNETALQRALTALIQRHDSLRLCFPVVDGEATVQLNDIYNPLSVTDISELSETEQQDKVSEWIANHAQTAFELSTGPLLSLRLLKLGQQEQILLFNMHHIISDGWSMGVLIREWSQLYNAYVQNQEPQLPALPIQYTDYAAWQRNWLSGSVLEQQLAYWTAQLAGLPQLLELPTDYPRPAIMRYQGKHLQSTLEQKLTQGIKQLSQQHGVTIFMTLLAAFKVLLSRYSGQTDLVVGSPIANRTHHQTEELIGFFVNTLVLRTQVEGEQTFTQLLKQVRQTALEAYQNQDIPFEYLVEQLNPTRSISHSPLFQVMFVLQNAPEEALELSGLKMSVLEPDNTTAKFDLTLGVAERGDVLVCNWEYNTDLFRPETVTRMTQHFQVLLEGIIKNSEQSLSQLPLITSAEQQQLLAWNQTDTDYPKDETIVDLFQAQVEKTPQNVAVVFEGQALSYEVLNTKANQLAHYLMTLGVGAETLVGICVERSLEMVIGLLGILKAGGAYVPLDPAYPKARLAFMLEDTQVPVLLTKEKSVESLPDHQAQVVCLDTLSATLSQLSTDNPVSGVKSANLAYVMYTSGSTGQPKGISVVHRGVVRLVKETNYVNLTADEVFLQVAPISFDASTLEIWGSLLNGAKLIVMPPQTPSLENLGRVIGQYQVTTLWLTASLFNLMVDERLKDLKPVRQLLAGGEALSVPHVRKALRELKQCQLINGYGPTENTTFTCCCSITESKIGTSVPIGSPIANTQVYILDAHLQAVPVGVPGELHIGGAGLARGYLNRPDLTAEKFIPNPDDPDSRLYKTGDLARYLPDGNIEYLGRLDNQVKIRGFRIELGEIEAVLAQHPAVQESVVIIHEESSLDKRLVAYMQPIPEQVIDNIELRRFITNRLPNYMIPSALVQMETMPLNPNGKIDRNSLPAPEQMRPEKTFVAPRDKLELQLTKIWEQVLGIQPIGVRDNFFDLGGHSLLAVRLFAQIEKKLGRNIPLTILFQAPTIEQLSDIIRQKGWSMPWSSLVPIQPNGGKPALFCVPPGGNTALSFVDFARHLGMEQPVYGLQPLGFEEGEVPHNRVEDMAAYYIKEIRSFQPQGPYYLGGTCFGAFVAFEMAQQLLAQGCGVALLALFDPAVPGPTGSDHTRPKNVFNLPAYFVRRALHYFNHGRLLHALMTFFFVYPHFQRLKQLLKGRINSKTEGVFDAHLTAQMNYIPQIYPGKITLFRSSEIHELEKECFWASRWSDFASGGFDCHIIECNHLEIFQEPPIQELAEQLKVCLDEAAAKTI